jgi:hypothetical protein
MKVIALALILVGLAPFAGAFAETKPDPAEPQPLEKLADDFWRWRAQYAPFTGDDVNRTGLVAPGNRPSPEGPRGIRNALEENQCQRLANSEAS